VSPVARRRGSSLPRKSSGRKERERERERESPRREGTPKVGGGGRRPGRRTSAPASRWFGETKAASSMVGVSHRLRPQAPSVHAHGTGLCRPVLCRTLANHPCQGPCRRSRQPNLPLYLPGVSSRAPTRSRDPELAVLLPPAHPNPPDPPPPPPPPLPSLPPSLPVLVARTRPLSFPSLRERGRKREDDVPLLRRAFVVAGAATSDRFAHRLHHRHPRMQSLPHCRLPPPPPPPSPPPLLPRGAVGVRARVPCARTGARGGISEASKSASPDGGRELGDGALGSRCFIGFGIVISGAGIRPRPHWRAAFDGNE
jgi:hypothetical protein